MEGPDVNSDRNDADAIQDELEQHVQESQGRGSRKEQAN